MKQLILFLFLIINIQITFAQDCYKTFLDKGIEAYHSLDFEKAINQFKAAQICDDLPADNEIKEWIEKSQNGYIDAIKKEQIKAQSLALTAKSIIELKKNDDASKAFQYAKYAWEMDDTPESRFALYDCFYQLESRENRKNFYIRDVKVFENLRNRIRTIDFIDGGQTVFVTGERNAELLLYDFDGNKIADLTAEVNWYTRQAYSEGTNILLSTEKINKKHVVKGHHLKDGKLNEETIFQYPSTGGDVTAVAISKDGERIAACFYNGEVHILNKEGKLMYQLPKQERGAIYLSFSAQHQLALAYDRLVMVYDLKNENGELLFKKEEEKMYSPKIALSPFSKYLMTAYNSKSNIWDIKGDSIYRTNDRFNYQLDVGMFSTDEVHATFGPQFLNLKTKTKTKTLVKSFSREVRNMKFSIDKKYLAANIGNNVARLWIDQEYRNNRAVNNGTLAGHKDFIGQINFSPDTTHLITGSMDRTFKIWNPTIRASFYIRNAGRFMQSVDVEGRNILAMAKGKQLNFYNNDGSFRSYHSLPVNQIVTLSRDGKHIFANVKDGFEVWSLDLEGKRLGFKNGISGTDSTTIADFSTDNRVAYFTASSSMFSLQIWNMETRKTSILSGYDTELIAVEWSPDNKHIAAIDDYGKLYLWNVEDKPKLIGNWKPHSEHGCLNLSFSKDGQKLLTCGHDNTAAVWDLKGDRLAKLIGHIDQVNDANFSKDGRFLITASNDRTVRIWTLEGQLIIALDHFDYYVQEANFSSDGKHLIARYGNDNIKISPFDPQLIVDKFEVYGLPDLSDKEKTKYGIEK